MPSRRSTESRSSVSSARPAASVSLLTRELDLPFADEQSVVQTRFATTVLALLLGAYGWDVEASAQRAERHLTETLPDWAARYQAVRVPRPRRRLAIAQEAALKFREILATWSEGYATMEYRHGPISAINERSLVWILDDQEPSIDDQIRATGARLIRGEGDPLAELVRIHRFAQGLVELRGINPDQPPTSHVPSSWQETGRRPVPPTGTAVLALDMGATKLAAGIGTPDGEVSRVATVPTHASEGAEAVLEASARARPAGTTRRPSAGGELEAIGVSTMGYTQETHVELATNVPGWTELRIPEAVERPSRTCPRRSATTCTWRHRPRWRGARFSGQRRDLPEPRLRHLRRDHLRRQLPHRRPGAAGEVGYTLFRGQPEPRMAADGHRPRSRHGSVAPAPPAGSRTRVCPPRSPTPSPRPNRQPHCAPVHRRSVDRDRGDDREHVRGPEPERRLSRRWVRSRRLGRARAHPRADGTGGSLPAADHPRPVRRRRIPALRGAVALALARGSARVILTVTANVAIDRTYVVDQLASAPCTRSARSSRTSAARASTSPAPWPRSAARRRSPA